MIDSALLNWMLDSDPVLRWQVERDLVKPRRDLAANPGACRHRRIRFAAARLARPGRSMGGGAFLPGDFDFDGSEARDGAGQPWTATTWTLNSLREWGLDPSALEGTVEKLAVNSRWEYDDLPYWGGEVDCCINGWTLANGSWLGADVESIA